jgi:murein DD-endopeptidase MepM/ murein hydrolase activator NlpD/predicted nucleic acid-binding Zn ribbon protein
MAAARSDARCFVCGDDIDDGDRLVLLRGNRQLVHCSESCLRETVRKQRAARAAAQLRWTLRLSLAVLVLVGAGWLWQRFRVPHPESIAVTWPEVLGDPEPAPRGPPFYGPAWPPTDEEWTALFSRASWVYPLPGPNRRLMLDDRRIFGPEAPLDRKPYCRRENHCGVDIGGELWGEHVYAVADGVIDRVITDGRDPRGGISVRLVHFGGMVFTQYFHLAATPRAVVRGAHVKAGDVIGLLGDTGLEGESRHLYFALSIRPSKELSEVYWDPAPWLSRWPLRLPLHGTVAGFMPP